MKKAISLKEHRAKFTSDIEAAEDLQVSYWTYRRWLYEQVHVSSNAFSRRALLARGIELPRRPEVVK